MAEDNIDEIVKQMSLREKAMLLVGCESLVSKDSLTVYVPGYVASQEVIFGGQGETLKISTDTINRECYMPGVALGCRKIVDQVGLVYGLDKLL